MLKNFFETKTGRNFIIGIAIFSVAVVGLIGYSIFTNKPEQAVTATNKKKAEKAEKNKEKIGQYNATMYSGKWYSNREDQMTLELDTDGTYHASSWLTAGTYYLIDNGYMVLDDKEGLKKKFKLQTRMGSTILYLKDDKEEIYLYPNEEVKEKMEKETSEQTEAAQQVVSQAWLDVLKQGPWENTNDKRTFVLEFKDDTFVQKRIKDKKTEEEVTYHYRMVSITPNQEGALCVMSKTDESGRTHEVSFSLTENGSKYLLNGDPGSFDWITLFEKSYEKVTPTQDGTTRDEASKKKV